MPKRSRTKPLLAVMLLLTLFAGCRADPSLPGGDEFWANLYSIFYCVAGGCPGIDAPQALIPQALVPYEVQVTVDCYQPLELETPCEPEVALDLRGARQGVGYAPLPSGLSFDFDPPLLAYDEAGTKISVLTIDTTATAPGSYDLVIVTTFSDGRWSEAALPITVSLPAETITWTGAAGDGLWTTAGNWDLGRLPTEADSVILPATSGTVTLTGPDEFTSHSVTITQLTHQGGTLSIIGPANCSNCHRLKVAQSWQTSGASTKLFMEGGVVEIGAPSTFNHVEGADAGGRGGGIEYWGDADPLPEVVTARLDGYLYISGFALTVTEGGLLSDTFSLGQMGPASRLTIAEGAELAIQKVPGSGTDIGIAGNAVTYLEVRGSLSTEEVTTLPIAAPVLVTSTGVIEANGGITFQRGLETFGTVTASNLNLQTFGSAETVVLHPGSLTNAATEIEARTQVTVNGQLTTSNFIVSSLGGGQGSLLITDINLVDLDWLGIGTNSSAEIRVATPLTPGDLPIRRIQLSQSELAIVAPNPLFLDQLTISGPSIVRGWGDVGLAGLAVITAESFDLSGHASLLTFLQDVSIETHDSDTILSGQLRVRGTTSLTVAEDSAARFVNADYRADPDAAEVSFDFVHLGSLRAFTGASVLEACVTTGPAAVILPPNGASTLDIVNLCGP